MIKHTYKNFKKTKQTKPKTNRKEKPSKQPNQSAFSSFFRFSTYFYGRYVVCCLLFVCDVGMSGCRQRSISSRAHIRARVGRDECTPGLGSLPVGRPHVDTILREVEQNSIFIISQISPVLCRASTQVAPWWPLRKKPMLAHAMCGLLRLLHLSHRFRRGSLSISGCLEAMGHLRRRPEDNRSRVRKEEENGGERTFGCRLLLHQKSTDNLLWCRIGRAQKNEEKQNKNNKKQEKGQIISSLPLFFFLVDNFLFS